MNNSVQRDSSFFFCRKGVFHQFYHEFALKEWEKINLSETSLVLCPFSRKQTVVGYIENFEGQSKATDGNFYADDFAVVERVDDFVGKRAVTVTIANALKFEVCFILSAAPAENSPSSAGKLKCIRKQCLCPTACFLESGQFLNQQAQAYLPPLASGK